MQQRIVLLPGGASIIIRVRQTCRSHESMRRSLARVREAMAIWQPNDSRMTSEPTRRNEILECHAEERSVNQPAAFQDFARRGASQKERTEPSWTIQAKSASVSAGKVQQMATIVKNGGCAIKKTGGSFGSEFSVVQKSSGVTCTKFFPSETCALERL